MSIREDLKAYYDGELPPTRAAEVEAALARDPELREELREIAALTATFRAPAREPEPVGLDQTLAALEGATRPSPRHSWLRVMTWTAAAAAVVAAIVIVGPMMRQSNLDPHTVATGAPEVAADAGADAAAAPEPTEKKRSEALADGMLSTPASAGTPARGRESAPAADIVLRVPDVASARLAAIRLARDFGGRHMAAAADRDAVPQEQTLVLMVPEERADQVAASLIALQPVAPSDQRQQLSQFREQSAIQKGKSVVTPAPAAEEAAATNQRSDAAASTPNTQYANPSLKRERQAGGAGAQRAIRIRIVPR